MGKIPEGYLSEVGTSPPRNLDTPREPMDIKTKKGGGKSICSIGRDRERGLKKDKEEDKYKDEVLYISVEKCGGVVEEEGDEEEYKSEEDEKDENEAEIYEYNLPITQLVCLGIGVKVLFEGKKIIPFRFDISPYPHCGEFAISPIHHMDLFTISPLS